MMAFFLTIPISMMIPHERIKIQFLVEEAESEECSDAG